jgi:hypothetical protein
VRQGSPSRPQASSSPPVRQRAPSQQPSQVSRSHVAADGSGVPVLPLPSPVGVGVDVAVGCGVADAPGRATHVAAAHASPTSHTAHVAPSAPHADAWSPRRHTLPSQQPVQLSGVQAGRPPASGSLHAAIAMAITMAAAVEHTTKRPGA